MRFRTLCVCVYELVSRSSWHRTRCCYVDKKLNAEWRMNLPSVLLCIRHFHLECKTHERLPTATSHLTVNLISFLDGDDDDDDSEDRLCVSLLVRHDVWRRLQADDIRCSGWTGARHHTDTLTHAHARTEAAHTRNCCGNADSGDGTGAGSNHGTERSANASDIR